MGRLISLLWQGFWQIQGARFGVPFDVSQQKFLLCRQITNQYIYRYVIPRVARKRQR